MEIILYTQPGCSRCEVLKRLLDQKKLKYQSVTDNDLLIKLGFTSTPVLKVDKNYMTFNEAVKFVREVA